jgi:hypothetical protein
MSPLLPSVLLLLLAWAMGVANALLTQLGANVGFNFFQEKTTKLYIQKMGKNLNKIKNK